MPKAALSRASVAAARCPASQSKFDLFDTNMKNFGLEVRHSGAKTFFVRYYDAYRRKRQFKIGDANVLSLSDARTRAREVLRSVELGNDPRAEKAERRETPTFEVFVRDQFLPFVQRHKRSWKTDDSLLRNHILPAVGRLRLGELQPAHFLDLQTALVNAGKAPGTTDRVLILCRYICNCAIKWKVPGIKANPTADVPLLHVDNTKQRFLSDAETRRLLATLEDARHGPIRPIVLLLFLTGARRGEVLNARWDEFDLERRIWRIPETKSGRPRTVPLSVSAVELLAELKRGTNSPFVCPNRETGKPFVQVHKAWKRLCRDADLHDLRIHDLRHNFASHLVNNNRTLYEVQRILGHSNIKITERYAHLAHESLLEAADTVGALIANANQAAPGRAPAQA